MRTTFLILFILHLLPFGLMLPKPTPTPKLRRLAPTLTPLPKRKISLDNIQPPDHLDAVRMEQDGHLNRDYKKEIFLGNHEEIDNATPEEKLEKLKKIFALVDVDNSDKISQKELEDWIMLKVRDHFEEATQENAIVYKQLDLDKDGSITWKEFHAQFLIAKGHDPKLAEKQAEDYDAIAMSPEDKDKLIRFKFRWADADEDPQDNKLTVEEFRNFRHPEQSRTMLDKMAQDILENLDQNQDHKLTEDEFAALPPGEVDDPEFKETDRAWQQERRKEFRKVIDTNGDGEVDRAELKNYVDPQNRNHAFLEAKNLISLADADKDGRLSWAEVEDNQDLFFGSKMVNTGQSFHDEF